MRQGLLCGRRSPEQLAFALGPASLRAAVPHDPNRLEPAPPSLLSRLPGQAAGRLIAQKYENARPKDRLRYQERVKPEKPLRLLNPFGQTGRQAQHPGGQPKEKRRGPGHAGKGRRPPCSLGNHPYPAVCPDPRCVRHVALASWPKAAGAAPSLTWCRPKRGHRLRTGAVRLPLGVTGRSALRHPGCLPKGLLGHRLLAYVAQEYYVQGTTMGRLARQLGLHCGSLLGAMHDLAARLESVPGQAGSGVPSWLPVKHADETGWRNDGRNGYAGLFCTPRLSLFRFRQSRSGQGPSGTVCKNGSPVLGDRPLCGLQ